LLVLIITNKIILFNEKEEEKAEESVPELQEQPLQEQPLQEPQDQSKEESKEQSKKEQEKLVKKLYNYLLVCKRVDNFIKKFKENTNFQEIFYFLNNYSNKEYIPKLLKINEMLLLKEQTIITTEDF
jgi:hypothetical protein